LKKEIENKLNLYFSQITQQRRPLAVKGRLDFMVLKSSTVPQVKASKIHTENLASF
jgi:hypothetical protein